MFFFCMNFYVQFFLSLGSGRSLSALSPKRPSVSHHFFCSLLLNCLLMHISTTHALTPLIFKPPTIFLFFQFFQVFMRRCEWEIELIFSYFRSSHLTKSNRKKRTSKLLLFSFQTNSSPNNISTWITLPFCLYTN